MKAFDMAFAPILLVAATAFQASAGRIQLQSEGFGIEYRNIILEPL